MRTVIGLALLMVLGTAPAAADDTWIGSWSAPGAGLTAYRSGLDYLLFDVLATRPLTAVRFDGLGTRIDPSDGETPLSTGLSFCGPEPFPGSVEDGCGDRYPSFGWNVVNGFGEFRLVHPGFTGSAELRLFDGVSFTFDERLELEGAEVTFDFAESTTTPEPVSMALLGTGLAGLAAVRRRRRREDTEQG